MYRCASSIVLAVGPFEVASIPGWRIKHRTTQDDNMVPDTDSLDNLDIDQEQNTSGGFAFCLPGYFDDMMNTIQTISHVRYHDS